MVPESRREIAVCTDCGRSRVVLTQDDGKHHPLTENGVCECGSDEFELVGWEDVDAPAEEE